jgi:hypothetical protein
MSEAEAVSWYSNHAEPHLRYSHLVWLDEIIAASVASVFYTFPLSWQVSSNGCRKRDNFWLFNGTRFSSTFSFGITIIVAWGHCLSDKSYVLFFQVIDFSFLSSHWWAVKRDRQCLHSRAGLAWNLFAKEEMERPQLYICISPFFCKCRNGRYSRAVLYQFS